jgi:putative endonuclease
MKKKDEVTMHDGWVLYILKCRGDRLYTGISNDLQGRLRAHREGKGSKFVRAFSPFALAGVVLCKNGTEARKLEISVKKMRRSEKLDFLKAHHEETTNKGGKEVVLQIDDENMRASPF